MTPSAPSESPLYYDILSTVAQHADTETILSIMRCCRSLHREAIRALLAKPVSLDRSFGCRRDKTIDSFLRFMGAEDGTRWRLLRGLVFGGIRLEPETARAVAEGIRCAPNIESLEFEEFEDMLISHRILGDALATLHKVKHIKLSHAAKHTCQFLERVQWPLVTAELRWAEQMRGDWELHNIGSRMHPAALLRPAQHTLVELTVAFWDGDDYRSEFPSYPNVRSLDVEGLWTPITGEWVKTYPNLRRIAVFSSISDTRGADEDDVQTFGEVRNTNMEALEQQCWSHLDEVTVRGAAELYMMGLPCRVRKLDIGYVTWSMRFFPEAVRYLHPITLTLRTGGEQFGSLFKTHFEEAARDLQELEELHIEVRFERSASDVDAAQQLVDGVSVLQLLPKLRTFALTVDIERSSTSQFWVAPSPEPSLVDKSLLTFDRGAFCCAVFDAVSSLESIELKISGVWKLDQDEMLVRADPIEERFVRQEALSGDRL
ncbi:hypothetical protein C8Q76DRAFT_801647 [Earliella scabrosa]|nr:hypothetical protein C8Q76DRAFT_801647 [Earliella scabrosa]